MRAEIGRYRHQFNTGFCSKAFDCFAPFRQIRNNPLVAHPHNMACSRRQYFINKAAAHGDGGGSACSYGFGGLYLLSGNVIVIRGQEVVSRSVGNSILES